MSKEQLTVVIKEISGELNRLDSQFSKCDTVLISKKLRKREVELTATKWFQDVEPCFQPYGIPEAVKTKYHDYFTKLLKLALENSRKNTYQRVINAILENIKEEILIPIIKSTEIITSITNISNIMENASLEERDYLNEAIGCANRGFLRASMVLVWCGAVYRIQKIIEKLGIEEFNKKSEEMKKITEGRFKRFGKSFSVHSLSELRATVFDTDLLWVLEYWGLIDANQHSRLDVCFIMRNSAAHPGEAVITEPNLASAFSDLKTILFDNPRFSL
jgi:hypothetical protein